MFFALALGVVFGPLFVGAGGWARYLGWYGLLIASFMGREVYIRRLLARDGPTPATLRRIAIVCALSGSTASLCLPLFADHLSEISMAVMSSILVGWTAVAVSLLSVEPKVYRVYAVTNMAVIFYAWLGHAAQFDLLVLGFALIFGAILLSQLCHLLWRQQNRENALNAQLSQALRLAEQADKAKTRFLASASHDLRQPLHVIGLITAALSLRPLDATTKGMVNVLCQVNTTLSSLLDSLLDISKLDAGLVQPQNQLIPVARLLQQAFNEMAPLIRAKGLRAELDIRSQGLVNTDPALLARILNNLNQNALKFTTTGSITLRAVDEGDQIVLEVADTGCGIAPEHLETVFQEFFQVNNPQRDPASGLGLGLSIVQRLSRLLGVQVQLHSVEGQGTRVQLRMLAQHPVTAAAAAGALGPPDPQARHFGLNVLVIDDDPSVLYSSELLLKELGCVCRLAEDLESARAALVDWQPGLILADFRLRSALNGIETIQKLWAEHGPVPALLVSGDTAPDRLQMAQAAGIRLVHKPIRLAQLMSELDALKPPSGR